jgi:hypothetical protein
MQRERPRAKSFDMNPTIHRLCSHKNCNYPLAVGGGVAGDSAYEIGRQQLYKPFGFARWFLSLILSLFSLAAFGQATITFTAAPYNAIGDCSNSVIVSTTASSTTVGFPTTLSAADTGKVVIIFGCGTATSGGNCQDLITTIVSESGTNATLAISAGASSNPAVCIYGHNNATALQMAQNTISNNILSSTLTTVLCPAGNYLAVPLQQLGSAFVNFYCSACLITSGGGTWMGTGAAGTTTFTGCGGWQLLVNGYVSGSPAVYRGQLFTTYPAITDGNPYMWSNIVFDGGIPQGYYGTRSYPASTVTGQGWDQTHGVMDEDAVPVHTLKTFANCTFQHWRGEMIKTLSSSFLGGQTVFTNCVFNDGNATALNLYTANTTINCLFTNLFQVEERYQLYATNAPSWFNSNTVAGCSGGIAVNGGSGTNTAYYITNCVFNMALGGAVLGTTPGDNVYVQNCTLSGSTSSYGMHIGESGYQGYFINSNIWFTGNKLSGGMTPVYLDCGTTQNAAAQVHILNNTATGNGQVFQFIVNGSWTILTNVFYGGNTGTVSSPYYCVVVNAMTSGSWVTDLGGNSFTPYPNNYTSGTAKVDYPVATQQQIQYVPYLSTPTYYLSTTDCAGLCVPGSVLTLGNANNNGYSATVYYLTDGGNNPIGTPVTIANNASQNFYWTGTVWTPNANWNASIFSGVTMSGVTAY